MCCLRCVPWEADAETENSGRDVYWRAPMGSIPMEEDEGVELRRGQSPSQEEYGAGMVLQSFHLEATGMQGPVIGGDCFRGRV